MNDADSKQIFSLTSGTVTPPLDDLITSSDVLSLSALVTPSSLWSPPSAVTSATLGANEGHPSTSAPEAPVLTQTAASKIPTVSVTGGASRAARKIKWRKRNGKMAATAESGSEAAGVAAKKPRAAKQPEGEDADDAPPSPANTLEQVLEVMQRGCDCENSNCYEGLSASSVLQHRLNIAELSKDEHDMYLMGMTMACLGNIEENSKHKQRKRLRPQYRYQGKKICQAAFLFLENVTKYQMKSIRRHLSLHGVSPRVHGNQGRKPHNTLPLDTYQHAVAFMEGLIAKQSSNDPFHHPPHTVSSVTPFPSKSSPGASSGKSVSSSSAVPGSQSSYDRNKAAVHALYLASCEMAVPKIQPMGYSCFLGFLRDRFPGLRLPSGFPTTQKPPPHPATVQRPVVSSPPGVFPDDPTASREAHDWIVLAPVELDEIVSSSAAMTEVLPSSASTTVLLPSVLCTEASLVQSASSFGDPLQISPRYVQKKGIPFSEPESERASEFVIKNVFKEDDSHDTAPESGSATIVLDNLEDSHFIIHTEDNPIQNEKYVELPQISLTDVSSISSSSSEEPNLLTKLLLRASKDHPAVFSRNQTMVPAEAIPKPSAIVSSKTLSKPPVSTTVSSEGISTKNSLETIPVSSVPGKSRRISFQQDGRGGNFVIGPPVQDLPLSTRSPGGPGMSAPSTSTKQQVPSSASVHTVSSNFLSSSSSPNVTWSSTPWNRSSNPEKCQFLPTASMSIFNPPVMSSSKESSSATPGPPKRRSFFQPPIGLRSVPASMIVTHKSTDAGERPPE
ncbi:unnamed protein product [Cyprideis torosa]|uniref:Uncharacterized protein n=1 Tax=Cyprideis torosa TaxID=163714 RepID=A0A7R8WGV5_9CRUS|nr:unnamed protein product [Cyprideis torosa]CAG0893083.1 unnamed protein product [Cyprideis torosa]